MSKLVELKIAGRVAVVTVDNPPVNALSPGVPEGIINCMDEIAQNDAVDAVVLIGAGRGFIAGADIKHLGKPRSGAAERYRDVLENSAKPVVAAIHGFALGGGLETAMVCHYRIATRSAKVGLPEVLIGILPGAGGTQRLPRLVGAAAALDMVVSGRHVDASEAAQLGLIDELVDGELEGRAIAYAEEVARLDLPLRARDREDKLANASDELFESMRRKISRRARNQRAPYACIEAIEAAVKMPFDEGLAKERALLEELVNADQAKALRYAFFAEREARKIPGVPSAAKASAVDTVAVIGAGTMGGGIAMSCANAGIPVLLLEQTKEALDRGFERIEANYQTSVKRGSMSEQAMQQSLSLIEPVMSYDALAKADFAIEAVFEDMSVKAEVFAELDGVLPAHAVLASNTSALNIDALADTTKRAERVLGTHFFSPANVMKLLEIVRGQQTAADVLVTAMELGQRIGKTVAVCGNCFGFLANRSRAPFGLESAHLLTEGALPEQIDKVMFEFGYPVGPFVVNDIAGIDVGYLVRQAKKQEDPDNYVPNPVADRLYEMGRYGQKTGAGFYRYESGDRTPHPDPIVAEVIQAVAREQGVEQRQLSDEEILHRLLFSSVNEAAHILQEGIAYRASDVDVMWLGGFNFPRYRGGLMYWADQIGVDEIFRQIQVWQQRYGARWKPAPLLEQLARNRQSFADWQAART